MTTENSGWSMATSDSLFDGLRCGDPDAWSRFVRLYVGGMSRWLIKQGLQMHDRDDVIQRVLKNVFVGIDDFRRDPDKHSPQLRPWLMTILQNTRMQLLRELRKVPRTNGTDRRGDLLSELIATLDTEAASSFGDNCRSAGLQRELLAVAMAEAREKFPHRWEAFWRKYSRKELTFREIGFELGMTAAAARQAHFDILKWLKHRLGNSGDSPASEAGQ